MIKKKKMPYQSNERSVDPSESLWCVVLWHRSPRRQAGDRHCSCFLKITVLFLSSLFEYFSLEFGRERHFTSKILLYEWHYELPSNQPILIPDRTSKRHWPAASACRTRICRWLWREFACVRRCADRPSRTAPLRALLGEWLFRAETEKLINFMQFFIRRYSTAKI